jgi:hypothetical protein
MQTIRSVGVLSIAKIMGTIYLVMGLIFVPFFLLAGVLGSMAGAEHSGPFAAVGAIGGLALAVIVPVVYGLMGFVIGAIGALLYNLMAGWIGGIQINLQPAGTVAPMVASN